MANQQASRQFTDLAHVYRDWSASHPGRRAFGYLCTYAPIELLHAAGYTPVRLMQLSGPVARANAHLPSFACALARAVTERMLSGEFVFLHGVLFAHTCDTMQCLTDIWRMARVPPRVVNFSLPTVLGSEGARSYMRAELSNLASVLSTELGSPVTQDALMSSIAVYNEQRRLLSSLYEHRDRFSAEHLWSLTAAATLTPVEEHNTVLRSQLDGLDERWEGRRDGPSVFLVGAVLDDPLVMQLVGELGGQVVGDDLCTGSRYFDTLVDETGDPFEALARRYLLRRPCPAKHDASHRRAQAVLDSARASRAAGVIFALPKFCDPHAFDYASLARELDACGIPHLLIETELTPAAGQLRTRLQAFLEMLGDSRG